MEKIASRLLLGVSYRQVVLTLPYELRSVFYNHPEQGALYGSVANSDYVALNSSSSAYG